MLVCKHLMNIVIEPPICLVLNFTYSYVNTFSATSSLSSAANRTKSRRRRTCCQGDCIKRRLRSYLSHHHLFSIASMMGAGCSSQRQRAFWRRHAEDYPMVRPEDIFTDLCENPSIHMRKLTHSSPSIHRIMVESLEIVLASWYEVQCVMQSFPRYVLVVIAVT